MRLEDHEIEALAKTPFAIRVENAQKALMYGDIDGRGRGTQRPNNVRINIVCTLKNEIQRARARGASLDNISDIILRATGITVSTTTLCKYADLYDNGSVH